MFDKNKHWIFFENSKELSKSKVENITRHSPFKISLEQKQMEADHTSLASGTRPWTVVTTDHANVDMLSTRVSETPANKYA